MKIGGKNENQEKLKIGTKKIENWGMKIGTKKLKNEKLGKKIEKIDSQKRNPYSRFKKITKYLSSAHRTCLLAVKPSGHTFFAKNMFAM